MMTFGELDRKQPDVFLVLKEILGERAQEASRSAVAVLRFCVRSITLRRFRCSKKVTAERTSHERDKAQQEAMEPAMESRFTMLESGIPH
jgi:hypothetical protein